MELGYKMIAWVEALSPEVLIGVLVGIVLSVMMTAPIDRNDRMDE